MHEPETGTGQRSMKLELWRVEGEALWVYARILWDVGGKDTDDSHWLASILKLERAIMLIDGSSGALLCSPPGPPLLPPAPLPPPLPSSSSEQEKGSLRPRHLVSTAFCATQATGCKGAARWIGSN